MVGRMGPEMGHSVATVRTSSGFRWGAKMTNLFRKLWSQEEAQDIAEYAVNDPPGKPVSKTNFRKSRGMPLVAVYG